MRFTGSFHTTVHHGPSVSRVACALPEGSVSDSVPGSARDSSTGMHILLGPARAPGSGRGGDESTGRARSPAAPARITVDTVTSALLTDLYELTMLEAAREAGTASRRCVFEVFTRSLPQGRRYGALAGTGRVLEAIEDFRFDDADLRYLRRAGVLKEETLEHLAQYRFTGDVHGYAEGELYFPGSPAWRPGARVVLPGLRRAADRGHVRERGAAGDGGAVDPEPRQRRRLRGLAHDHGGARTALHRDGRTEGARGRRDRRGPCRVHRRLRLDLEPRRGRALPDPGRRHGGPRLHPAVRHRGGGLPRAADLAGHRDDGAGGHLRRRVGGAQRRGAGRPRAGGRAPGLRGPRRAGRACARAAGLP